MRLSYAADACATALEVREKAVSQHFKLDFAVQSFSITV